MSMLLKNVYSKEFYERFAKVLKQTLFSFDEKKFRTLIFDDKFADYELKERMTHTAKVLHHFLSDNFEEGAKSIQKIIENLIAADIHEESFEYMFFPEYIEIYGLEDYENSIKAFEFITQYTSCEFAVRPYLVKYESNMLEQMLEWSNHSHPMVRRLASEGSRPRLPWAMALPMYKNNPAPIKGILENLKDDENEIVRRSVANNLNDISKDNPSFVIDIAQKWIGKSKQRDALVKHACRTLLKEANPEVLKLFGFDSENIHLENFKILTSNVKVGDRLAFVFSVHNSSQKDKILRTEYGLYYKKKNGTHSKKVFKISEKEIKGKNTIEINREQSFKVITTRKFHKGLHRLSIILNGEESDSLEFTLMQ